MERVDPERLQAVLEQALATSEAFDSLADQDLEALRRVARRQPAGAPAGEAAYAELVHALLERYFEAWGSACGPPRSMSERIAQSLIENPVTQPGLARLWRRLAESV